MVFLNKLHFCKATAKKLFNNQSLKTSIKFVIDIHYFKNIIQIQSLKIRLDINLIVKIIFNDFTLIFDDEFNSSIGNIMHDI